MKDEGRRMNEESAPPLRLASSFILHPSPLPARAFTVTELLIVIGILVLVLALAVPAFNFITGSRSIETASNNIAAMLARARTEAIGLQQMRGVFFYVDAKTQGVNVALVEAVDKPVGPLDVDVYLDLSSDRDVLSLPRGIAVQVIDNSAYDSQRRRTEDGYIGFNNDNDNNNAGNRQLPAAADNDRPVYGGVILFDSRGHLVSRSYAFKVRRANPAGPDSYTAMGVLLYEPADPRNAPPGGEADVVPVDPRNATIARPVIRSALGYVLFDLEQFTNGGKIYPTNRPLKDWQPNRNAGGGYQSVGELEEERWLDQNATVVMINRYTGALVKGE
jgi:type II secretory pathway pseudopilin PulG